MQYQLEHDNRTFWRSPPGQEAQHLPESLTGWIQSTGGQCSTWHRGSPWWQMHCVQLSMSQVSPSTSGVPSTATHLVLVLGMGLRRESSSGNQEDENCTRTLLWNFCRWMQWGHYESNSWSSVRSMMAPHNVWSPSWRVSYSNLSWLKGATQDTICNHIWVFDQINCEWINLDYIKKRHMKYEESSGL